MASIMAAGAIAFVMLEAASAAAVHPQSETVMQGMLKELFWFTMGAIVVRLLMYAGIIPEWRGPSPFSFLERMREERAAQHRCVIKQICANTSSGLYAAACTLWDREKKRGALPFDGLQDVALSLQAARPQRLVSELVEHCGRFPAAYPQPSTLNSILEVIARSEPPGPAEELIDAFQKRLNVVVNPQTLALLHKRDAVVGEGDDDDEAE